MLIIGFRTIIGPRGGCRYPVSCTHYAIKQIETAPLWRACYRIAHRLLTCHPFSKQHLKQDPAS